MMTGISFVAIVGFLLLPRIAWTSTENTVLLRGRKTEEAGMARVSPPRVLQFFDWWDCDLLTEEPCFDVSTIQYGTQNLSEHPFFIPVRFNGHNTRHFTHFRLKQEFWNIVSCAPYAEGGCPCPSGQKRCGATDYFIGYCASLCCDPKTQHSCWEMTKNFTFDVTSCAATDKACTCPEGQMYCGYNQTPSELCSPVCCDANTEILCINFDGMNYTTYCRDFDTGC
ncbi:hypothetical protein ACHAW6_015194 [Cyclotella cf. meneghiniana]